VFYFLFLAYLIVFSWLITKVPAIQKTGISSKGLIALFVLKVAVGSFYGWITKYYYGDVNDTWVYFNEGSIETNLLLHKPVEFLTNILHNEYKDGIFTFFQSAQSFWHSLKTNLFIKFIAILNLFSFKNYWIDVIFFNFLFFFGFAYFYRLLKTHLNTSKIPAIFISFLMPSLLLFTSGIHKEAVVFASLSYLIFKLMNWYKDIRIMKFNYVIIFLLLLLLFIIRDYVVVAFAFATSMLVIMKKSKWNPYIVCFTVYLLLIVFMFNIGKLIPSLNFPAFIVKKQHEFGELATGSLITINPLDGSLEGFFLASPRALFNILFKPHLLESGDIRYIIFSIELFVYYLLIVISIFFRKKNSSLRLQLFLLFFSLTMLIIIGLIVPNVGSIVRYRSIYFPYLIGAIVCSIDLEKFLSRLRLSKPPPL
jgi:hypothetical protein